MLDVAGKSSLWDKPIKTPAHKWPVITFLADSDQSLRWGHNIRMGWHVAN